MVTLSLNAAQLIFLLLIICEVTYYARSVPGNFQSVSNDQKVSDLEADDFDESSYQLMKALNFSKIEELILQQNLKIFVRKLIQSYNQYTSYTDLPLVIWAAGKNAPRCGAYLLTADTRLSKFKLVKTSEKGFNRIFIRASSGNTELGFFYDFKRFINETPGSQALLKMGYNYLQVDNGLLRLRNRKGEEGSFRLARSLELLKNYMKDFDSFGHLAKLVNRRTLRIEFILEDQLNQMYIMFFHDFERPDAAGEESFDFTINSKRMSVFRFEVPSCGAMTLPILMEKHLYLRWSPDYLRYRLYEMGNNVDDLPPWLH